MRLGVLIILFWASGLQAAIAQTVDEDVRTYFTTGSADERKAAVARLELAAGEGNELATYVTGTAMFFDAVRNFGADINRHGFESPRSFIVPLLRLPVPENSNPEPLDYQKFRKIFEDFEGRLAAAEARLGAVSETAEIAVEVDFAVFGLDLDGNGAISSQETLAGIVNAMQPRRRQTKNLLASLTFKFDRADGYWLQGYANFLMATIDFWLAHDFQQAFDQSFHLFFPRAALPMQVLVPDLQMARRHSEWKFLDLISLVHLTNWQVIDPERRADTRRHLLEMIALSRKNWQAIRLETDNDREWLPGPHQPGINPLTGLDVGEEQVAGWHDALQVAEDLLNGERLLARFRFFDKGLNMKRFFEEPQPFDLVLTLTGPGAIAYLETGNIVSRKEWRQVMRQFDRGRFPAFAIWFN